MNDASENFSTENKLILLPPWLRNMPDGHAKNAAENRFYLRLAALYATEAGTLANLAFLIGINCSTLKSQTVSKCRASRLTKDGIRRLLGDSFVPPELPELRRRLNDL